MFSHHFDSWLEAALDYGISEAEFWDMTLAELIRVIDSKKRVEMRKAKEKASFDYILADLIGRSISRLHSASNTMPSIADAYPGLFQEEQARQQVSKDELSAARFKQFAESYNKKRWQNE